LLDTTPEPGLAGLTEGKAMRRKNSFLPPGLELDSTKLKDKSQLTALIYTTMLDDLQP